MDWKQAAIHEAEAEGARTSVLMVDIDSGEEILDYQGGRRVVSASTIKVPIMLAALSAVQRGEMRLETEIGVEQEDILDDSEVFEDGARSMSLGELIRWMIIVSDNTATNALLRHFTMERINAYCQAAGLKDTRVERLMLDYAAMAAGKNNYTSARDQYAMFSGLYQGAALGEELRGFALDALRDQRCQDGFLRHIAGPVRVAHKTGSLDGIDHDSGVFELDGMRYYLGVFVTDAPDNAFGRRRIGRIAKIIYEANR